MRARSARRSGWCRAKTARPSAGIAATLRRRGRANCAVCWCKRRGRVGGVTGVARTARGSTRSRTDGAAHRGGGAGAPPQSDFVCALARRDRPLRSRALAASSERQRATRRGGERVPVWVAVTIVTEIAPPPRLACSAAVTGTDQSANRRPPGTADGPSPATVARADRRMEMWKSTDRIPTFPHAHLTELDLRCRFIEACSL